MSRIVGHLKGRIAAISNNIARMNASIKASKFNIKSYEDELFAFKVEKQALTHALKEWEKQHE